MTRYNPAHVLSYIALQTRIMELQKQLRKGKPLEPSSEDSRLQLGTSESAEKRCQD